MAASALLARLEGVRQTAPGRWIAKCPCHPDRSPSLSVRELPDGRVLMKCFAGCDTQAVLEAIDLSFADLYPERLGHHVRQSKTHIPPSDLILICHEEILAASMLAAAFLESQSISEVDWRRLAVCSQRLGKAVGELRR